MALEVRNRPLNACYEESHWSVRAKAFSYWSVLKNHTSGVGRSLRINARSGEDDTFLGFLGINLIFYPLKIHDHVCINMFNYI